MDKEHEKKVAEFRKRVEAMPEERAFSICSHETDGYPEDLKAKPEERVAAAMKLWPQVKAFRLPGRMGRWCDAVLSEEARKGEAALVRPS